MEARPVHRTRQIPHEHNSEISEARMMALLYNRPWARTVMKPLFVDQNKRHVITHSIRVTELAVDIGEQAGLSEEDLDLLRLGGFLHDNGKRLIPSALLNSNGRLSDRDKEASFDPHPRWGFDALVEQSRHVNSWKEQKEIQLLANLIITHHEFKKNKPYPRKTQRDDGEVNEKMLKLQQILALSDYIESRTDGAHLRNYNHRLTLKDAVAEAREELDIDSSLFEFPRELCYSKQLHENITHYLREN